MAEVCKDLGEQLDRTEFYDWIKLQLHTQSSSFSPPPLYCASHDNFSFQQVSFKNLLYTGACACASVQSKTLKYIYGNKNHGEG